MSSEGFPQDAQLLPNFQPLGVSQEIYSFTYERQKEAAAKALPPEQEGAYRAAVVAECPMSEEGWREYGVKVYGENVYQSTVSSTIANGARDPAVTAAMLEKLNEAREALDNRVSPELAQTIVTRTLNTGDADPNAAIGIVTWAFDFIPDEAMRIPTIIAALRNKTAEQLEPLLQALQSGKAEHHIIRTALEIQKEQARLSAEAQRKALETREAEAAQKRAIQEAIENRRSYIVNNVVQAFREIISANGITTIEDVATAELAGADELLFVTSAILGQDESRSIALDGDNAHLAAVATAILDRAVVLQRTNATFTDHAYPLGRHLIYSLNQHEDRKVTSATSTDDFWDKVAELAEQRDLKPQQVSDLYEGWRSRFIRHRELEQAKQILSEHGIDPDTDFRPEGIDALTITVPKGAIIYAGDKAAALEELLSDMRGYFTPRTSRFESGTTTESEGTVGNIAMASTVSILEPGGDAAIMDMLETAIREWAGRPKSHRQAFTDPNDRGSGDPYKYSAGLFGGHGISIEQNDKGQFLLYMQGRGYDYNERHPTQHIDAFAAFTSKRVTYDGNISLAYRGEPPTAFDISARERTIGDEIRIEDSIQVSLPVDTVLRQLQGLLGLDEDTVRGLWNIIESKPSSSRSQEQRQHELVVGISPLSRLPREAYGADGHILTGYTALIEERHSEGRYFFLPELRLDVKCTNPNVRPLFTELFHAIGTITRHSPRKSYATGYTGAYNAFHPNAKI